MAKKRPYKPNRRSNRSGSGKPTGSAIGMKRLEGARGWIFIHPKCATERADDFEEVRAMVDAGETEIAKDELRWLVSGCPDFIAGHALLGEIAAAETDAKPDLELARGHFGYGYQLGEKAIKQAGCNGPLLGTEPANAAWHDAAFGLAWCFEKLGRPEMADQIAKTIRRLDPADPAGIGAMLDDLRSGGAPIIELGG